ncbi:MAG: hypothetical protein KBS85_01700 [Lachnospiraceae bacterium]|nr:hypothetical protein [Candidatus Merdinaster equi]
MIQEEKISIMTHLAIAEQREGKQNASIRTYFRGDYIGLNVIKGVLCATICYVLIGVLNIAYNLNSIMADVYTMDYLQVAQEVLSSYLMTVVIFVAFSYIISLYNYYNARKNQKNYLKLLKRLSDYYKEQS